MSCPVDAPVTYDPHVADVGTALVGIIVDQCGDVVDVSAATGITVFLKRPGSNGTVLTKTGVLDTTGTDGKIRYNTIAGDFSVAGIYRVQFRVTISGATWSSRENEFYVKGNLG